MNRGRAIPENVAVRRAIPADADAILDCLRIAFEPHRASYTPGAFDDTVLTRDSLAARFTRMSIFVAVSGTAHVIGTIAAAAIAADQGHIRGMAVVPEWQGRGVADQLMSVAENELIAQGCSRVTLDTTAPLQRAMRFYERFGFQRTGRVRDFHGMPLFEYAKPLFPVKTEREDR